MITANTPISELHDNTDRIKFLAAVLQSQLFATQPPSASSAGANDLDGLLASLEGKKQDDFKAETRSIFENAAKREAAATTSSSVLNNNFSSPVAFPFYSQNPLHQHARTAFSAYVKSQEILLRFNDISGWDETHGKVLELLTDDNSRDSLSLEEYKSVMKEFEEWNQERGFELPRYQSIRNKRGLFQSSLPMAQQPGLTLALFYSCPAIKEDEDDADSTKKDALKPSSPTSKSDDDLAMTIATAVLHKVDARSLFQKYVKSISIVKTEAELIMCDGDGDGRVTITELETYMSEIIPTVTTLQQMPPDMIPFYTCSSARRIFWILDPTGRGTIKISSLVNNPVIDDWLEVQMMAEEQARNWFGVTIAMQLRDKFDTLDMYGMSALNLECIKRYKKGIPMVVDDGLPKDISPLSSLFLERAFDTMNLPRGEMDYAAFVDFVVAVEFLPASCPRPMFFWRIFDIFGEGRLTPLVVHSFFKETYEKLKSAEVEVAPIDIIIQEIFDLIPSKETLVITKNEFISAKQCGLFSALLVDCLAFYTYENREQK